MLLPLIFWTCVLLVLYAYAFYPALIWIVARWFGEHGVPPALPDGQCPSITILIAAYNEEAVLADRIDNALAMDYPPDRLHILIASDGSTDHTPHIVRRYAHRGVRLLDYPQRRGKATVLNTAMVHVNTDLVLLSDANTHIDRQAARHLVRWFGDPNVRAVCGRLVLTDPATGRNADSLYWKYENFMKQAEGRLGALLGANGAIYALRRRDYVPLPPQTIIDDFVIPLLGCLKAGGRIIYDEQARATEETALDVAGEFRRRSRIGAGGFQALVLLWKFLDPRRGWVAFTFFSHKVLRWLCPFFLLGMLFSNTLLWDQLHYGVLLASQAGFYLLSAVVNYLPRRVRFVKPLRLAPLFAGMNLALLLGFFRWLGGTQSAMWKRTLRPAELDRVISSGS